MLAHQPVSDCDWSRPVKKASLRGSRARISPSQPAAVDSASRWAVFRWIELPQISGAMWIVLLLRLVDSFMIYTEVMTINAGGPNDATTFLSLELGEDIKAYSYGTAAARAMVDFVFVLVHSDFVLVDFVDDPYSNFH